MFDAKRLLDQFLGAQGSPMSGGRQDGFNQPARGQGGGGLGGGGLGDLVGGLGNVLGGSGGGLSGGAVAGGLAALLLGSKSGRKMAGGALQIGGMAVVGALAYKAYQDWQSGRSVTQSTVPTALPPPPPADTPFLPTRDAEQQSLSRHLLRAMIAAAKCDGHIDAKEQATIFAEMDKLPLDADDKAFVMDELRKPLDVAAVAGGARSPEEAASIYTASLLAIDVDNPAERGYLGLLAARLHLDEALVKHLHATVENATLPQNNPAMAS